jgi:hypothetical protein
VATPTESLTGAICNAFRAAPTLATYFEGDNFPGIYVGQVHAQKTALPWVELEAPDGKIEWDTGGVGVEETTARFRVFGNSAAQAENGAIAVQTVFDAVPPVITFPKSLMMAFLRMTPPLPQAQEFTDEKGNVAFVCEVGYNAMVQRFR